VTESDLPHEAVDDEDLQLKDLSLFAQVVIQILLSNPDLFAVPLF
jgi:hypothetical protein